MGLFKKPSWKRALGITRAKQKIARMTGIPTTRQGRQQKLGRLLGSWAGLWLLFAGGRKQTTQAEDTRANDAAEEPEESIPAISISGCLAGCLAMVFVVGACCVGPVFVIGLITGPKTPKDPGAVVREDDPTREATQGAAPKEAEKPLEGSQRPNEPKGQPEPKADSDAAVRKLFEEQLQKSKAQHTAAVAKHEAELKDFNKSMEEYEKATAEYPAKVKDTRRRSSSMTQSWRLMRPGKRPSTFRTQSPRPVRQERLGKSSA